MKRILAFSTCGLLSTVTPLATTFAQVPSAAADRWASVRFLLGSWEGTSTGHSGTATVRREYRFVLRDQFIEERNTSTYLPQERNPKGEVHEHVSYISHDRARKLLVLRQFHVERFVIQYVQESDSSRGRLAFVSEAMENTPLGWRARESYIVHGPGEFEEIFELAQAGKPFEVYSRTRLKRVP
ncbi:MAG TPA: hypothetical protein VJ650_07230 [Gemmatimonadaceae bacterium]|nr:hypothetical protein [Gemmatimonadaceae bacterium]